MTDFDRIASSTPLNRTASMVTGKGETWTPAVVILDYFADMPPLSQSPKATNPEFIDFTGAKFGRLTVIGIIAKESNTPAAWVCRCVCGGFCTRRSKSLKVARAGGNSFVDRCGKCAYEQKLRNGFAPRLKAPPRYVASSLHVRKKLILKGPSP